MAVFGELSELVELFNLAIALKKLGQETAFKVLKKAKELEAQGRNIIHLEIGEPDFDTPQAIIDKAVEAMRAGHTKYTASKGAADLCKVAAEYTARTRNITVCPENIVITPGAKPLIILAALTLLNKGDEVIIFGPAYPIYESVMCFIGAMLGRVEVKILPLSEENGFVPDIGEFKKAVTSRTKIVVVNNPQNPLGSVFPPAVLQEIVRICGDAGAWILADEVYERIVCSDQSFVSIAEIKGSLDRIILMNGYSKTYAMTGWRLGYGAMPKEIATVFSMLCNNSHSCVAEFIQIAGAYALRDPDEVLEPEIVQRAREYQARRDHLVPALNKTGILEIGYQPAGAFYTFPKITIDMPCEDMERRLLEEAGVAALAGNAFGVLGEGYMRIGYANSLDNIKIGIQRIADWAKTL